MVEIEASQSQTLYTNLHINSDTSSAFVSEFKSVNVNIVKMSCYAYCYGYGAAADLECELDDGYACSCIQVLPD